VAFPGRIPWIITVGASCKTQGVWSALCPEGPGKVADFSSRGKGVDVLAPGVDIWGAAAKLGFENTAFTPIGQLTSPGSVAPPPPGSGNPADEANNRAFYLYGPGTSFATPHVAGIVALMLEANPVLTQQEIEQILQGTAVDLGPAGFDPDNGHGHVDAFKAVELAASWSHATPAAVTQPAPVSAPAVPGVSCGNPASRTIKLTRPRLVIRCTNSAALVATMALPRKTARKLRLPTVIARGRSTAASGESASVELKLTSKALKRLRRLGKRQLRGLRPTLTAAAMGTSGGSSTFKWQIRLTR